ncbi:MAG: hypothetical protein KHX03_04085 [Clostridium sp.]|nr:hypothetical protein [Clostridium sp.]
MIQPLKPANSINAAPLRSNQATSFGDNGYHKEDWNYKRPSKAKRVATWAASEIVTGAIVSLIFDGAANLIKKAFPKTNLVHTPLKQAVQRAGIWGLAFLGIGLVMNGIGAAFYRNNK